MKRSRCVKKTRGRGVGRGRGRSRHGTQKKRRIRHKMIMKGGIKFETYKKIGLTQAYRFTKIDAPENADAFRSYTFGSARRRDLWMVLLRLCDSMNIPVYILTSGNKNGIIRALQLMNLDKYIVDVLCTNEDAHFNPINIAGEENFHGKSKYYVISRILTRHGLPTTKGPDGRPIGYFLDNDESNFHDDSSCTSIKSCLVKTTSSPEEPGELDSTIRELNDNKFYQLLRKEPDNLNFIPIEMIESITKEVEKDLVKILFLDYDGVFQIHDYTPTYNLDLIALLQERGISINQSVPLV